MPCERVKLPGQPGAMIVCTGRKPRRRCRCGSGIYTTLLCDLHDAEGQTCDKPLCVACAVVMGDDVHHCPSHGSVAKAASPSSPQGELPL